MILLFLLFALLYVAGYQLCIHLIRLPPAATGRNLRNAVAVKEKTTTKLYNRLVMPLVKPVSLMVRIEPEKEGEMASMLRRGGLDLTPREYYARALISALMTLPMSFAILLVGVRQLVPVTLAFSVIVYFHFMTDLNDKLKAKKEQIELGLPGFVRSILYKLEDVNGSRSGSQVVQADLIQIFEDYLKVAHNAFHYDIAILIMEMKSKDIETALRNFNERVGLAEVSFLANALIGLNRGEHQGETLSALARDMDIKARENIRKVLLKRPPMVRLASVPLVIVSVITLLYVIVTHLFHSVGGLL